MSLRTRFVIFCIGLLLIGLVSLAVLVAALTGRIESSPTGIAVFSVLGVSATGLGGALLTQRKRMPPKQSTIQAERGAGRDQEGGRDSLIVGRTVGISKLPTWVYWTAAVLSVGAAILAVVDQNTFRLVLSLFQIVFFTIFAVISQRHSGKL